MKRNPFKWYESLETWPKIFLSALATSLPFYFAAFLSSSVSEAYSANAQLKIVIHFAIFGSLITFITFFFRILLFYYQAYKGEAEEEHIAVFRAFTLCDRTVVRQHKIIKDSFSDPNEKLRNLIASLDRIQEIVDDAFSTFESLYGSQEKSSERIDFEITLMTKSYEDNYITIPCSASRSGHKPRSLVLREENINIYNNTETAKLYRAKRLHPIIISDTSVADYYELYSGQKERIKSTIIYPVLSEENSLLGTLVVHCDRSGFFTKDKEKFWSDLLEIFAKRISVEKMKLDMLDKIPRESPIQINLDHKKPF